MRCAAIRKLNLAAVDFERRLGERAGRCDHRRRDDGKPCGSSMLR
jgi:hypothetical protein